MRYLILAASLLSLSAHAQVTQLACETKGPIFLRAQVSLLEARKGLDSDTDYGLDLTSEPRGAETLATIQVFYGSGRLFSTVKLIPLADPGRVLLQQNIEDFTLTCELR